MKPNTFLNDLSMPETPDAPPEHGPQNLEIELKILNIGSPEEFEARVTHADGKPITERALIADQDYKPDPATRSASLYAHIETNVNNGMAMLSWQTPGTSFSLPLPDSPERLNGVLSLLGIQTDGSFPADLPKRTVRIRTQGERMTLTIKEPRKKGADIDERKEREVYIQDKDTLDFFLRALGFAPHSLIEKYRTDYSVGDTTVSFDELPGVPPFAEVEGPNREAVFEVVEKLGFTKERTAIMTKANYLRMHGVPEEKLREVRF